MNVLLLRIEVSSVVSHVGGFVEANVGGQLVWFQLAQGSTMAWKRSEQLTHLPTVDVAALFKGHIGTRQSFSSPWCKWRCRSWVAGRRRQSLCSPWCNWRCASWVAGRRRQSLCSPWCNWHCASWVAGRRRRPTCPGCSPWCGECWASWLAGRRRRPTCPGCPLWPHPRHSPRGKTAESACSSVLSVSSESPAIVDVKKLF